MHYVVIRDDDTNALTSPNKLDLLYRPFLDRELPVCLSVIPKMRAKTVLASGELEGYIPKVSASYPYEIPLMPTHKIVEYLRENLGYHIVQHGYYHEANEFYVIGRDEAEQRIIDGARILMACGFPKPQTFVAPYDVYSRRSLVQIAKHFRVFSTGWFQIERIPLSWLGPYLRKKMLKAPHWKVGETLLLSHPGCLLSYHKPYDEMLTQIKRVVKSQKLTVLVTHWWEYFRKNKADKPFIQVLHETAKFLDEDPEVQVIPFNEVKDFMVEK